MKILVNGSFEDGIDSEKYHQLEKRCRVNLLVRGNGPGCDKESSIRETPEKNFKNRTKNHNSYLNLPGCVVD